MSLQKYEFELPHVTIGYQGKCVKWRIEWKDYKMYAVAYVGDLVELESVPNNCIPRLFIDGDSWCALYGENLQEGIAGFGDSPNEALKDFENNLIKKLNEENEKKLSSVLLADLEDELSMLKDTHPDAVLTWIKEHVMCANNTRDVDDIEWI